MQSKQVAVATLFGAVIFVSKTVVPSPIDKMFIIVQALLLALGALLLRRMGATYVSVIGGVLTALWRVALAPFTFGFALLYGLLVDAFFFVFKVNTAEGKVKTNRLIASMTVSTASVGLFTYYVTTFLLDLLPRNPVLEVSILAAGIVSGALGGLFASIIWNKHLKHVKL